MSNLEITSTIEALLEYQAIVDEASAIVENLKDALKKHMDSIGADELTNGTHSIYWKTVTTNRVDTGLLRKTLPDVAAQFTRATTSRRFTIA